MSEDLSWFSERLHVHLDPFLVLRSEHVNTLFSHFQTLVRWNSKSNLTSIRSPEEIVVRHYCESLFFLSMMRDVAAGSKVADVGSGAGFPGFPFGVMRPDCEISLIEAHQRKAVFLRESVRSVHNIRVIAERAADVGCGFDWMISRAVSPRDVLKLFPKLATRVALLVGASDFDGLVEHSELCWRDPIQVPWGDRRIVVIGVPRETLGPLRST